jgi:hypothetical protein
MIALAADAVNLFSECLHAAYDCKSESTFVFIQMNEPRLVVLGLAPSAPEYRIFAATWDAEARA